MLAFTFLLEFIWREPQMSKSKALKVRFCEAVMNSYELIKRRTTW